MVHTFNETQRGYFIDRYALRGEDNQPVENEPEQMWRRVAKAISENEQEEESFYDVLSRGVFWPGGRILAGAGAESEKTLNNCFVIPVETKARRKNRSNREYEDSFGSDPFGEYVQQWDAVDSGSDSREAIFDTIATMVDIMSMGGGVGIIWSVLRPSGSYLTRISGTSSGPIGWMDVASKAVGEVIQGGSRRGAAMFMLDDWHPDILNFIAAKKDLARITNANISVAISDSFMEAVKQDGPWDLVFPDTKEQAYDTEWDGDIREWKDKGYRVKVFATVQARDIWRVIAESAWDNGEPGLVFLERYNNESTGKSIEKIIAVNPCGEQGLGAYSVCNLGSMNLDAYVKDDIQVEAAGGIASYSSAPWFDLLAFEKDVAVAVAFLDNVVDKTHYPTEETRTQQKRLRRIGLGVMGLADALVRLGLRYGSPEAVRFTLDTFEVMRDVAIETSIDLAKKKSPAEAWDESMWDRPFLAAFRAVSMLGSKRPPMRNVFLLTQAPTGTTSLVAGVNSGIEPYFSFSTWREDRTGGRMVGAKGITDFMESERRSYARQTGGHPDDLPTTEGDYDCIVKASDVTVEEHIAMQAAVQKYIDSSVSKTINAPNSHTVEDVEKAYMLAYDSGLKGIAYFRDGCGRAQVLYSENPMETIKKLEARIAELESPAFFGAGGVLEQTTSNFFGADRRDTSLVFDIVGGHDVECKGTPVREEGCTKCHTCGWSAC
jgi:ribonucleoside-diphosphate reductase alpha chain